MPWNWNSQCLKSENFEFNISVISIKEDYLRKHSFFCLSFFIVKTYLKRGQTQRPSIRWSTPQKATTHPQQSPPKDTSQEPPQFPYVDSGPSAVFPGPKQGAGWKVKQLGCESVPLRDPGTCRQSVSQLSHCDCPTYFQNFNCLYKKRGCMHST